MILGMILLLVGGSTLCAGIWLLSEPAAIIAAGVLLLAAGVLITIGGSGG